MADTSTHRHSLKRQEGTHAPHGHQHTCTAYKTSKTLVCVRVYYIFISTITSHVYSIILVHQGRESMNALDEYQWCHFLAVPATYVVSVCLFMSIHIIVPCYKLILSNCAERAWYLSVTLTGLGIVWSSR